MTDPSLLLIIFFVIAFCLSLFYVWLLCIIRSRYENAVLATKIIWFLAFFTTNYLLMFFWIMVRSKSNAPWWLEKGIEKSDEHA